MVQGYLGFKTVDDEEPGEFEPLSSGGGFATMPPGEFAAFLQEAATKIKLH